MNGGRALRKQRITFLKRKLKEEEEARKLSCDAFQKMAIDDNIKLLNDWIVEIRCVDIGVNGGRYEAD